jgi:membrane-bound lytic murein transglycosylase B
LKRKFYISILYLAVLASAQEAPLADWSPETEAALLGRIAANDRARQIYSKVFGRLRDEGVPADFMVEFSKHPEIATDKSVVERFSRPAEKLSYERYRKIFITDKRIEGGVKFYADNRALIDTVSHRFGVDPFLLVSLAGVESRYGRNAKTHTVFGALHTVIHDLPRKAKWVEREMAEYLVYCWENDLPPLSLYGSYAGAFGYGQFIPSSFRAYAMDFDNDGVRQPFEWPDVLASMANYLVKNGYAKGSADFSKGSRNWKSVFRYNPAENYVKVVLELREAIKEAAA